MSAPAPRYAPHLAFPPYAFVSPRWPHPANHPDGHMRGRAETPAPPLDPAAWRSSERYLEGVDLFNAGYYWEAHEAWESLWHAAGRRGAVADFLRALVKLAAAGVKARQGEPRGVRIHGERAEALFRELAASGAGSASTPESTPESETAETGERRAARPAATFAGLDLDRLADFARALAAHPEAVRGDSSLRVEVVFSEALRPGG